MDFYTTNSSTIDVPTYILMYDEQSSNLIQHHARPLKTI